MMDYNDTEGDQVHDNDDDDDRTVDLDEEDEKGEETKIINR